MEYTKASSSQQSAHFFHSSLRHPPSSPNRTKSMEGVVTGAWYLPVRRLCASFFLTLAEKSS
eukprot:1175968-Prorocentrum_lima.AAC.1